MDTITKTTQIANRYGLNVNIFAAETADLTGTPLMAIEFANLTDISISADRTWATGGQAHRQKIGFDNPFTGTLKISTQLLTVELLALMAGKDMSSFTGTEVVFETTNAGVVMGYIITADTVWKDASGNLYDEGLTAWKAVPKRALNISHNGDGEPTSIDVEFELIEDDNGKCLTIGLTDYSAPTPPVTP